MRAREILAYTSVVCEMAGRSKAFLELSRHIPSWWIQRVSGHDDFAEYHQRFDYHWSCQDMCVWPDGRPPASRRVSYCHLGQFRCSLARYSCLWQNFYSIFKACQRAPPIWRDPRSADTWATSLLDLRHPLTLLYLWYDRWRWWARITPDYYPTRAS